jgi:hypothetical protein
MSRECIEWGEETRRECSEYRDEGYNQCAESEDRGYRDCCDWWPCSWVCDAWVWVSNIVCVAWYWVSNVVCVAWTYITTAVCLVWEAIITVFTYIILVVELIVGTLISIIDFVLELIFSIPIIGRFLRELLSIIQEIIYRLIGLFDALLYLVGIRPEKKLRLCVIILRSEEGLVADEAMVLEEVQRAADIFREQANVRVIPCALFNAKTPFHGDVTSDEKFIHLATSVSSDNMLDVSCGAAAWGEDFLLTGSNFNLEMTRLCFCGNARRLLGYGSPVTVFIVRSIDGGSTTGCSLGPLTDYITVVGTEIVDKTTIAHETGHACGLWHVETPTNLMFDTDSDARNEMSTWQQINFRNSRHVTYF